MNNPHVVSRLSKLERLRRFHKGCQEALQALYAPPPTDAERADIARKLGRPDLIPEPQQDDLPIGPDAA